MEGKKRYKCKLENNGKQWEEQLEVKLCEPKQSLEAQSITWFRKIQK
jgi:hypothetical protein